MARIAFLHESPFEFLGVMALYSYLDANGHETEVFIASEEGKLFWDKVKDFKPDWVGLSTIATLHQESYRLAAVAKEKLGVKTVLGGPYVSFLPSSIEREEADVVVRGEGEEALLELMNATDKGADYSNILNLSFKKNGTVVQNSLRGLEHNLDKYPVPHRRHYYKYKFIRNTHLKHFISGRDCPYNCYFCYNQQFRKLYDVGHYPLRRRSPEHVLEELRLVKANYPLNMMAFDDDVFPINRVWLSEFLPKFKKEIGVQFSCNIHASMVNEETSKLLAENGCRHVMMGLESGNPRVRKEILGKKFSNEQFLKSADILHKYGIKIMTYNILGNPTETLDEAIDTVIMNNKAKIEFPWWSIYQPMPGTQTTDIAVQKGYIDRNFSLDNAAGSIFRTSHLKQPDIEKIIRLHKLFYLGVKFKSMIPVIRKMTNYNLGPIYQLIFLSSYFTRHWRESGMNFFKMVLLGLKQLKNY